MCAQAESIGLVLQGGGALGAYEIGVIEYLLEKGLKPAIVSGISSGAVNATLLCGARDPNHPLDTLTKAWDEFTIPLESITSVGNVPFVRTWPSTLCNPAMYRPRYTDYVLKPLELTSVYDTSPLRETLTKHIAWDALVYNEKEQKPVDPSRPRLILAATNIETGNIDTFDSRRMTIEPDHVLASGALPPGFPPTPARDVNRHVFTYWDGGLYDNTPLAQVIHALEGARKDEIEKVDIMIVVNLFPKNNKLPANFFEVIDRSCEIIFANKTSSDIKRAKHTRELIKLKEAIKQNGLTEKEGFKEGYEVLEKKKAVFDDLVEITYTETEPMDAAINFAKETIDRRRSAGYRDAKRRYEKYLDTRSA